jgi:hypothetical protein
VIGQRTPTEAEFKRKLQSLGCVETSEKTATATIWKHPAGFHFMVPFAWEGYYPDWMQADVLRNIDRMVAQCAARKKG